MTEGDIGGGRTRTPWRLGHRVRRLQSIIDEDYS